MAGGGGKIPVIITNLTVGPNGCRGQAICFRGGASEEEAPPYHGRQSPPEGVPQGRKSKEDSGSTGLAQLLFGRSGSSRRALNSLLGNSPSHG